MKDTEPMLTSDSVAEGGAAVHLKATFVDTLYYKEVKMSWPFTVYIFDIQNGEEKWRIYRRYDDFFELHEKLTAAGFVFAGFPPKKWFGSNSTETVNERKKLLNDFVQWIVTTPEILGQKESLIFFRPIRTKEQLKHSIGWKSYGRNVDYEATTLFDPLEAGHAVVPTMYQELDLSDPSYKPKNVQEDVAELRATIIALKKRRKLTLHEQNELATAQARLRLITNGGPGPTGILGGAGDILSDLKGATIELVDEEE